jgi:hypothetical protein
MKTPISGRTACLKRCKLIAQKSNNKCMILNWITDQEDRLPALIVLPVQHIFCSSRSEFGESFTVNLQMSPAEGETQTDGDRRQELVSPQFEMLQDDNFRRLCDSVVGANGRSPERGLGWISAFTAKKRTDLRNWSVPIFALVFS